MRKTKMRVERRNRSSGGGVRDFGKAGPQGCAGVGGGAREDLAFGGLPALTNCHRLKRMHVYPLRF